MAVSCAVAIAIYSAIADSLMANVGVGIVVAAVVAGPITVAVVAGPITAAVVASPTVVAGPIPAAVVATPDSNTTARATIKADVCSTTVTGTDCNAASGTTVITSTHSRATSTQRITLRISRRRIKYADAQKDRC
jgi:hypothetical protein